jgi:hypothetical protein
MVSAVLAGVMVFNYFPIFPSQLTWSVQFVATYIWLRVDHLNKFPDTKDPTLMQRTNMNLDCVSLY